MLKYGTLHRLLAPKQVAKDTGPNKRRDGNPVGTAIGYLQLKEEEMSQVIQRELRQFPYGGVV
jgi:hypothetical protein